MVNNLLIFIIITYLYLGDNIKNMWKIVPNIEYVLLSRPLVYLGIKNNFLLIIKYQ